MSIGPSEHPTRGLAPQAADVELARLIVEVTSGEAAPSAHITVGELLMRWVEHRRRAWRPLTGTARLDAERP
jgi:hypothetical protein